MVWQIFAPNLSFGREDDEPLNGVAQLADVARPIVMKQILEYLRRKRMDMAAINEREFVKKGLCQLVNIFFAGT